MYVKAVEAGCHINECALIFETQKLLKPFRTQPFILFLCCKAPGLFSGHIL